MLCITWPTDPQLDMLSKGFSHFWARIILYLYVKSRCSLWLYYIGNKVSFVIY